MSFESFLVYTTEVGGPMHVWWADREKYEYAASTGRLNTTPYSEIPTWETLKMVAFAPVTDLRDFVLEPVEVSP